MFNKVYAHTSFIGETGYSSHARNFFTTLNNSIPVKVRNFSVGKTWDGLSDTPHNNEEYLIDAHKKMIVSQTLFDGDNRKDYPIYDGVNNEELKDVVNIVLMEVDHYYFYDDYKGPKIAYNVWESTLYPDYFFNKLLEFDQLWVPSKWQKDCAVKQGMNPDVVKVVPEGVEGSIFFPEDIKGEKMLDEYKDNRFKFILFGRWDHRKSINEIIETFLKTFNETEEIDLVISVDNKFPIDGMKTTEERLSRYGFDDSRIKVKHFPTREEYIKFLKTGHVFVSCARSEGWNLPLIEAMACGTPSIYSNWGAQLEFAEGRGLPVDIKGERQASDARFLDNIPGNYCEPDFDHLSKVMRDAYVNYSSHKQKAIIDSKKVREEFSWENAAKKAMDILKNFSVISYDSEEFVGHGGWWKTCKIEVYDGRVYEKYFTIKKGDIVVDIGAHAGFFSLTCVGREIDKCYCIEPFEINFDDLNHNISLTGEKDKFVTINKALSSKTGIGLYNYDDDLGIIGDHYEEGRIEIPTISFLDFVKENKIKHIDFLKFDCERGEYDLIGNEENWEYLKNNVKKMAGEIHFHSNNHAEGVKLIENLSNLGFDIILNSVDGIDITEYFYTNIEYYSCIHIYATKKSKSKKVAFITGGDKAYMPFVKMCVQNLSKFSDIDIITYGYNCDIDFDCPGNIKKRIDFDKVKQIEGHIDTTYYFAKIQSCIDVIESENYDYYIWIDSDTIPSEKVSKVLDFVDRVENFPLCMRYNDQILIHWKEIDGDRYESIYGDEVCELFGLDPRPNGWLAALGLFIFGNDSKWFFEEVIETGKQARNVDSSKIKKDKYGYNLFVDDNAFSEERIANMLLWKYGFNSCLPITWMSKGWKSNVEIDISNLSITTDAIKRFVDEDYDIMFIFPEEDKNIFRLLPTSEEDIVFFHAKPKQKDLVLTNELYGGDKLNMVKLNLGCGDDIKRGYINVDLYNPNAEVQMDIRKLSYKDNSIDEILSSHALEHFSRYETISILKEWNRVLKYGGRLIMNLPDLEWCMLNWLNTPEKDKWGWAIDAIFGHQMAEGEVHQVGFTKPRLEYLLTVTGYNNISVINHQSHGQTCFLVHANKV